MAVLLRTMAGAEAEVKLLSQPETFDSFKARAIDILLESGLAENVKNVTFLSDNLVLSRGRDLSESGVVPGAVFTVIVYDIGVGDYVVYRGQEDRLNGRKLLTGACGQVIEVRDGHAKGLDIRVKLGRRGSAWFDALHFSAWTRGQKWLSVDNVGLWWKSGHTIVDLKDAGYSATELIYEGCTLAELKGAGYTLEQLLKACSFSAAHLTVAGYSTGELEAAGFSPEEMDAVGFRATAAGA